LVALGPFSRYSHIAGSPIYAGAGTDSPYYPHGLPHALFTHFVREGVAWRLDHASKNLPPRIIFYPWDCFRKLETQQAIFDHHADGLRRDNPGWDEERILVRAQRLVSLPSRDPRKPSPHNTGGAVDITLAQLPVARWIEWKGLTLLISRAWQQDSQFLNWKVLYLFHMRVMDVVRRYSTLLSMGSRFDEACPVTESNYYKLHLPQNRAEKIIARNRELLCRVLETVGFRRYAEEWWHFNLGNQMWAEDAHAPYAYYGAACFSEENQQWEAMRRNHHARQAVWHQGEEIDVQSGGKLGFTPEMIYEAIHFAKRWAHAFSKPSFTLHPQAAIL